MSLKGSINEQLRATGGRFPDDFKMSFVKTHPDAKLPEQAHKSDTGYDLYSVEEVAVPARGSAVVPVGLTLGYLTPGCWFRIEPRSGLGFKHNLQPHLGIIDNGYRGDLGVKLYNFSDASVTLPKGSKIAQIVLYLHFTAKVTETNKIDDTERGKDGFGSTGLLKQQPAKPTPKKVKKTEKFLF